MKKKIKDLNRHEIFKLCNESSCIKCPLCISDSFCIRDFIIYKNEIEKMMEKEIEVEE